MSRLIRRYLSPGAKCRGHSRRRSAEIRSPVSQTTPLFRLCSPQTSAPGLPLWQPSTTSGPPLSDSNAVVHPPRRPAGFQRGYRFCGPKVFLDWLSFYLAVLLHRRQRAQIRRSRDTAWPQEPRDVRTFRPGWRNRPYRSAVGKRSPTSEEQRDDQGALNRWNRACG